MAEPISSEMLAARARLSLILLRQVSGLPAVEVRDALGIDDDALASGVASGFAGMDLGWLLFALSRVGYDVDVAVRGPSPSRPAGDPGRCVVRMG